MMDKTMDLGKEAAARMLKMVEEVPVSAPPSPNLLDVSA
jgi:hypothetical protein